MKRHPKTPYIPEDDRLVTRAEVLAHWFPVHRSTLYREIRAGRFPRPIKLTPALDTWRVPALRAWAADREAHPIEGRRYFTSNNAKASAEGVSPSKRRRR